MVLCISDCCKYLQTVGRHAPPRASFKLLSYFAKLFTTSQTCYCGHNILGITEEREEEMLAQMLAGHFREIRLNIFASTLLLSSRQIHLPHVKMSSVLRMKMRNLTISSSLKCCLWILGFLYSQTRVVSSILCKSSMFSMVAKTERGMQQRSINSSPMFLNIWLVGI